MKLFLNFDLFKDSEDREDELYMKKLENGLFALQAIVYIIMDIYINGQESVKKNFKNLSTLFYFLILF